MGQKTSSIGTCELETSACSGLAQGTFLTNPNIAGWGVFIALSVGAFISIVLCGISAVLHINRLFGFCGINYERRNERDKKSADDRRTGKIDFSERIIQDLVLNLSDQQLVIGLALALAIRFSIGCDVSAYHYNITSNLILLTMTTHVCAIMVLPDYLRLWPTAVFLRIPATIAIIIFCGLLFASQASTGELPFPTAVPPLDVSLNPSDIASIALLLPAACFVSKDPQLANDIKDIATDIKAAIGPNSRYRNGFAQWILLTLLYVIALFICWFQYDLGKESTRGARWAKKVFWIFKVVAIAAGGYISVTSLIYIRRMRLWLDRSEWYEQNSKGKNPENDIFNFGQLVPLLMLILFGVTLFNGLYGNYKEQRDEEKSKEESSSNGSNV